MEPEEIDKLFRDKLAGRPVLPAPDAWMRLQQKMEPPKKERTRWIYYAAASVVMVLVAGLLFFRQGQQPAGPGLATSPAPELSAPLPEAPRPSAAPLAGTTPAIETPTSPAPAVRVQPTESKATAAQIAVKSRPRRKQPRAYQPEAPVQLARSNQQQATSPDQPASALAALPGPQPVLGSAAPDLSVVEVKVQRMDHTGEEQGLRGNLTRKGRLLKNIYKQARNLKNGEPVELAALGVKEGRLQEETKELKQKISNVISL